MAEMAKDESIDRGSPEDDAAGFQPKIPLLSFSA